MKKLFIIGFLCLMGFDTLAQICFKLTAIHAEPLDFSLAWLGRVFSNPWVYGSLLGYVGAFLTWMTLLKKLSIGTSFAASHLEVISVMAASAWLFAEPITIAKLLGAALILAGIVVLAIAEEKEHQADATRHAAD